MQTKTKLDFSAYERRYGAPQRKVAHGEKYRSNREAAAQNFRAAKSELPDDEPPRAA